MSVNGSSLGGWTFDAMNVLAWTEEAGCTAWLQFMVLPGGPIFMGTLKTADSGESPAGAFACPLHILTPDTHVWLLPVPGAAATETQRDPIKPGAFAFPPSRFSCSCEVRGIKQGCHNTP